MAHTFFKVPDWIMDTGVLMKLTHTEKDVLMIYYRYMNASHESFLGVKGIMDQTKHWKAGILAARKRLEELGIMKLVGYLKTGKKGRPVQVFRMQFEPPCEEKHLGSDRENLNAVI